MEKENNFFPHTENNLSETKNEVKTEINKIVEGFSLDEVAMLEKAVGDLRKKMQKDQESEEKRWPEDMEEVVTQLYEKIWKIQSLTKKQHEEK
jgi:hypothetical protein